MQTEMFFLIEQTKKNLSRNSSEEKGFFSKQIRKNLTLKTLHKTKTNAYFLKLLKYKINSKLFLFKLCLLFYGSLIT